MFSGSVIINVQNPTAIVLFMFLTAVFEQSSSDLVKPFYHSFFQNVGFRGSRGTLGEYGPYKKHMGLYIYFLKIVASFRLHYFARPLKPRAYA